MPKHYSRREMVKWVAAGGWSIGVLQEQILQAADASATESKDNAATIKVAPFRFDVTPPIGHGCCGGWIKPVEVIDDPLEAIGIVIQGAGQPIVLCAVDWTGLLNSAHRRWREALAEAAGTTPDRVAVQCVHQHNAPFACLDAQRLLDAQGDLPAMIDVAFFERCLADGQRAIAQAMQSMKTVTRIGYGQAAVEQVAANRRVDRDEAGKVKSMRGAACKDERLRGLPEGLIDPQLKTITFYHDSQPIAALHHYATHPMSYYGDGRVTSDFVGLARAKRQAEDSAATHVYFTGCAGNVAAGKYNDGSPEARAMLTERIYAAIVASERSQTQITPGTIQWRTVTLTPPPRDEPTVATLVSQIENKESPVAQRNRPAYELALKQRSSDAPIVLSALHLGPLVLVHLPGECFVEYQLRAQSLAPDKFVAVAAYGDGGPWYIPVKEEYPHGGYEVSVAFCNATIDDMITQGLEQLIQ